MIDKEKAKLNPRKQWTKFIVVLVLYLLFLLWVKSWWGLIVVPFIYDIYITKKIRWQWWRDSNSVTRFIMSWVDAIVFALVAVYFINLFFFQNFVIPSSSLEKSLLTGDYLFVSKLSYGPRIPETPLTMPLTQHTLPIINVQSYIPWPQWDYRRVKGLGHVELNDIVVFNYPAGDTILTEQPYQTEYYDMAYNNGRAIYNQQTAAPADPSVMNPQQQLDFFAYCYALGRTYLQDHQLTYGSIHWRPVDRRENYVKRCVGLPGMTLQVKNDIVYLNGKPNKEPDNVQYAYFVKLRNVNTMDLMGDMYNDMRKELGITIFSRSSQSRRATSSRPALSCNRARSSISVARRTSASPAFFSPSTSVLHTATIFATSVPAASKRRNFFACSSVSRLTFDFGSDASATTFSAYARHLSSSPSFPSAYPNIAAADGARPAGALSKSATSEAGKRRSRCARDELRRRYQDVATSKAIGQ